MVLYQFVINLLWCDWRIGHRCHRRNTSFSFFAILAWAASYPALVMLNLTVVLIKRPITNRKWRLVFSNLILWVNLAYFLALLLVTDVTVSSIIILFTTLAGLIVNEVLYSSYKSPKNRIESFSKNEDEVKLNDEALKCNS